MDYWNQPYGGQIPSDLFGSNQKPGLTLSAVLKQCALFDNLRLVHTMY